MFYDIFLELCTKKGVKPGPAAEACGINRSNVSLWKSKGYTPRGDAMNALAEYFGVSTDYLYGNEKKPTSKEDELIRDEFIAFYGEVKEDLDEDDINDLKTFMRMKAEIKRKNEKKE